MCCLSEFVLLSFWSSAQIAPQIMELLSNLTVLVSCFTLNNVLGSIRHCSLLVSLSHFSAASSHHFSQTAERH